MSFLCSCACLAVCTSFQAARIMLHVCTHLQSNGFVKLIPGQRRVVGPNLEAVRVRAAEWTRLGLHSRCDTSAANMSCWPGFSPSQDAPVLTARLSVAVPKTCHGFLVLLGSPALGFQMGAQ